MNEIKKISQMLTQNREIISSNNSYTQDELMVSAYTLFYLPTNIPKLFFLFSKLRESIIKKILNGPFIDYGCGPGTFIVALTLYARENNLNVGKLFAVDHSELMRKQAVSLFAGFNIPSQVLNKNDFKSLPQNASLFFGHSLNEMEVDEIDEVIQKLNPQNIIFIEPGTKSFFSKLIKLRRYFSDLGFNSVYPCAHLSKACPFESNDNWCHQIVRTTLPPDLSRLANLCQLNRKQMPMIAHVYSKSDTLRDHKTLVQYKGESKFAWEWLSCQDEKQENVIKEFTFLKRNHKGDHINDLSYKRAFDKLSVGDRPQIQKVKERTDSNWEVKLLNLSNLDESAGQ